MRTKLFPMVQFKKGIWEIDEFDCASMFLLEGTEKAMLIDCGMGIGDLAGAVRMITDKPLIVVLTHNHPDHSGNARQFAEIWMKKEELDHPIPWDTELRKSDIRHIARRVKGYSVAPFNMFRLYPFDLAEDIRKPEDESPMPVIHDIRDGQTFDLGGGRIVTAYDCPGHTPGEIVLLDEQSHTLFAGDAVNYNLGVGTVPLETTLRAMKRIAAMGDRYDGIWNGHHDFRALGAPLDTDCLPAIIRMMEDALEGYIVPCETPGFWGPDIPLSREEKKPGNMFAMFGNRVTLRRGRNWLSIDPENLREAR